MTMLQGPVVRVVEVRVTSIDRTAYPQFKRVITARELAGFFTPSGEEIEWARVKTSPTGTCWRWRSGSR
jgi:hypothetical protein